MNHWWCLLSVIPLTLAFVTQGSTNTVLVNSSRALEKQLQDISSRICNESWILVLDSSMKYRLSPGNFTHIQKKTFTITSNNRHLAYISCAVDKSDNKFLPTRGIAFINSRVTISRVSFQRCGMPFASLPQSIIGTFNNSSPLYYTSHHAGVLLFVNSSANIDTVVMELSYGFAITGANLLNSTFRSLKIHKSEGPYIEKETVGSGILLHFSNTHTAMDREITIVNTSFEDNSDSFKGSGCISDKYMQIKSSSVRNAAGLTVIYTQNKYLAKVTIDGGKFTRNVGAYSGAMLIVYFHTHILSKTILKNSEFNKNAKFTKNNCQGIALQFYWFEESNNSSRKISHPLEMVNTQFEGRVWTYHGYQDSGAVFIAIYCPKVVFTFHFKNLDFSENRAAGVGGICMYVYLGTQFGKGSSISVTMTDITARNNLNHLKFSTPTSLFLFVNVKNVIFNGTCIFKHNTGSVIQGEESNIFLHGDMHFEHNTGENGGGILLEGNGLLYLMEGLNAMFYNNRAYMSGGAIYIKSSSYDQCAIQFQEPNNVSFANNLAKLAGNSIFATPLFKCMNNGVYHADWIRTYAKHLNFSNTKKVNTLLNISTSPFDFKIRRNNKKAKSFRKNWSMKFYAGESIHVEVNVVDRKKRHVFSFIDTVVQNSNDALAKLWLTQKGGNSVIEGESCTPITVSIHTNSSSKVEAQLVFSMPHTYAKTYDIKILPCPLGFTLANKSGSCECSKVFNKLKETKCFIDQRTITRSNNIHSWIGSINKTTAISMSCPLSYCNTDPSFGHILSNDETLILANNEGETTPFCLHNRDGRLCGKCKVAGKYSMVFGSPKCKQCSNLWLLSIVIYAIAGPLLLCLQYGLKLTLTSGTLNGIIFYAQVANAGLLQEMTALYYGNNQGVNIIFQFCFTVLSLLNGGLGFSLCFYNGMNMLWKTGLSLAFPIYLLSIVVLLILLSRYSTWLSNRTSHSSSTSTSYCSTPLLLKPFTNIH